MGKLVAFIVSSLFAGFLLTTVMCLGGYGQDFIFASIQKSAMSDLVRTSLLMGYVIIVGSLADALLLNIRNQIVSLRKRER